MDQNGSQTAVAAGSEKSHGVGALLSEIVHPPAEAAVGFPGQVVVLGRKPSTTFSTSSDDTCSTTVNSEHDGTSSALEDGSIANELDAMSTSSGGGGGGGGGSSDDGGGGGGTGSNSSSSNHKRNYSESSAEAEQQPSSSSLPSSASNSNVLQQRLRKACDMCTKVSMRGCLVQFRRHYCYLPMCIWSCYPYQCMLKYSIINSDRLCTSYICTKTKDLEVYEGV